MKPLLVLAAFVGALYVAPVNLASACGMRFEPEPSTELTLARAAKHEAAEETYPALRLYQRAMYDDRANLSVRIRAAVRAGRLHAKLGDTDAMNRAYALVVSLSAKVAVAALNQEPEPTRAIEPALTLFP